MCVWGGRGGGGGGSFQSVKGMKGRLDFFRKCIHFHGGNHPLVDPGGEQQKVADEKSIWKLAL